MEAPPLPHTARLGAGAKKAYLSLISILQQRIQRINLPQFRLLIDWSCSTPICSRQELLVYASSNYICELRFRSKNIFRPARQSADIVLVCYLFVTQVSYCS
jgi:hypothetical protein